jgi:hypothetical protein
MSFPTRRLPNAWLRAADCHLDDLLVVLTEPTDESDYAYCSGVEHGVLVYDVHALGPKLSTG